MDNINVTAVFVSQHSQEEVPSASLHVLSNAFVCRHKEDIQWADGGEMSDRIAQHWWQTWKKSNPQFFCKALSRLLCGPCPLPGYRPVWNVWLMASHRHQAVPFITGLLQSRLGLLVWALTARCLPLTSHPAHELSVCVEFLCGVFCPFSENLASQSKIYSTNETILGLLKVPKLLYS